MADMKEIIAKVATGASLSADEAAGAFDIMMSGDATPSQIAGFLMALRVRGETVEEITGAAQTMRAKAAGVKAPADAIDIVGTGGDGAGTYNVSTCTSFVVAGCGVPIAKHGNRAMSSKSGAADVLGALGVNLEVTPERVAECVNEAGLGFMFAPAHHAAMRHVGPSRVELGTRTIFNLLGPMSNPAGVTRLLMGVFSDHWLEPIATAMGELGAEHVWVVHGADGLDEITTTNVTHVAEYKDGSVRRFEVTPEDAGLSRATLDDLKGGDGEANAGAIRDVLSGNASAFRDIVVLNAAAALIVAGKAADIAAGAEQAKSAIDNGEAAKCLEALVEVSNR